MGSKRQRETTIQKISNNLYRPQIQVKIDPL